MKTKPPGGGPGGATFSGETTCRQDSPAAPREQAADLERILAELQQRGRAALTIAIMVGAAGGAALGLAGCLWSCS